MQNYRPIKGSQIEAEDLKNLFNYGWQAYWQSFQDAREVQDLYHNRQYNDDQLEKLEKRGQPKETFNVVKMFTRLILGYYNQIVSTIKVSAQQTQDVHKAAVLNDLINYTFRANQFESVGDSIKLDGILTGLMCCYKRVQLTGKYDELGNPIKEIILEHVPSLEIILDPLSTSVDYSRDARFLHRFKWVHGDDVIRMFGKEQLHKLSESAAVVEPAIDSIQYDKSFFGTYKENEYFLIIHTIYKDVDSRYWSYFWSGEHILMRNEVTDQEDKFPYRVIKLVQSTNPEFYGVFHDIVETQKAINQAILKIQLTANSMRVFVNQSAADDMDKLRDQLSSINGIINVNNINDIKVENLGTEIQEQYNIIMNGLDRIQRVLGINDSFLGIAHQYDSGRKVKIQQQSTIIALRYLTDKIEQFYRLLSIDLVGLIKKHYTAHQVVRIADDYSGEKWLEINKPMERLVKDDNGQPIFDEEGNPKTELQIYQRLDTKEQPIYNAKGEPEYGAVYLPQSQVDVDRVDIEVDTASYNNEQEQNALILEGIVQGAPGVFLQQMDPAAYARLIAISIQNMKTRHSPEISRMLMGVSQNIQAQGNIPPPEVKQTDGRRISPQKEVSEG